MIAITKRLNWCMAHRLPPSYEGKCRSLHGHNYSLDVVLTANRLDDNGMLMDFGAIKELFGGWLNDQWDHAILVWAKDSTLLAWCTTEKQRHFLFAEPTTAENMACFLGEQFTGMLAAYRAPHAVPNEPQVRLIEVRVFETQDSSAVWGPDDAGK